jgi:pSer/pThr/pTyr-binding forkhead associated (FHA) protein
MVDPRLNSVHLEAPRRQQYRQAREMLLNARGGQTIAAEGPVQAEAVAANPHTLIQEPGRGVPAGLKFWLVDKDYIYPLKVGLNTIGRSADNDVVLQDCYVSRRHCAVLVHVADSCELHDTASKNGTYVNGRRIEGPWRLSSGDEIRMCDRQLVFISKSGGPPEPAFQSPTLAG